VKIAPVEEKGKPINKIRAILKTRTSWPWLVLLALIAMAPVSCSAKFTNVTAQEAHDMMQQDDSLVVIDVRSQAEYNSGHIPGTLLIPLDELESRIDEFDTPTPILVYCQIGVRSEEAADILISHGFQQVHNLDGGFDSWQDKGLPESAPST
jgi:rhodanese-related sulfurtransferase